MTGPQPPSYSELLADLTVRCDIGRVPPAVTARAAGHLLDGLGIVLGGSAAQVGKVAQDYLSRAGLAAAPVPAASLLGGGQAAGLTAEAASFLTGTYAFAMNSGDTSLRSVAHPNTVIVPVLLAAAGDTPVTGADFLAGLLAGYQVTEFLARSLNNGVPRMAHQLRGFRPTATSGAAGAAAAIARAWRLDAEVTQAAIEIGCNFGGGLRRHGPGDASSIWVHSGVSARAGFTAVYLALSGLTADREMIEGDGGFLGAYRAGALDETAVADLLPARPGAGPRCWAIEDVAFKFHSTAHTLATVLDCILDARRDGLSAGQVTGVEIHVPEQHTVISGRAGYQAPSDAASANNNYAYCAALVLRTGETVTWDALREHLADPAVHELASRVRVQADPALTERFNSPGGGWPARVVFETAACQREASRAEPYGVAYDDVSAAMVMRKFRSLAVSSVSERAAGRIAAAVSTLVASADVGQSLAAAVGLPGDGAA